MKKNYNRIVTGFAKYPTTNKWHRVWYVRAVWYDEGTPIYADQLPFEHKYETLQELLEKNHRAKELLDLPILDLSNNLQIYHTDEVRIARQGI